MELRDARAVLKAGSMREEEVWKGGPAAASGSPELRRRGGGALGVWGGELAREGRDWNVGVLLVLKRAREGEPMLFPELATAAARWRPQRWPG